MIKSFLIFILLFANIGCLSTASTTDEDTDMTATPLTTSVIPISTSKVTTPIETEPLKILKTSQLPFSLKPTKPIIPTFTIPLTSPSFFSSMPTVQTTFGLPLTTTLDSPFKDQSIGFPPLTPLWTLPTPAPKEEFDIPIKPLQNPAFPSFPTFPTLPPFTFPTLPPPSQTTIKPINITIDPEALMDVPEIVAHWGYPVETHKVVTADGYILTLHRIPHGKNETFVNKKTKPVVFLQHGLLCTSSIWLLNLPHQSAGYIFTDQGYDVWLGNMRGNTYSKQHIRLKSTDPNFWKFSWEEMARHDLPAMIDYVIKTTKQSQLYYVGHSQGALTMFAKMSQDSDFSHKVRKMFALAPVARMSHVKGLFHDLGEIYDQYNMVYQVFGDGEFLTNNIFTKLMTDILCDQAVNNPLCENFIFAVSGPNSNQFNNSRIGIYLAHNPAGTSSRNMLHFAQMVKTRRMARFDQGKELNMRYYGNIIPPEYDLRKINSSIYLFYSDFDWLADAKDVEGYLIPMLPKKSLKRVTKLKDFNHNDFLWGMRARSEIYEKIIQNINFDQKKLKLRNGLRKYLDSRPKNLPSHMNDDLMKQIRNETLDLD